MKLSFRTVALNCAALRRRASTERKEYHIYG